MRTLFLFAFYWLTINSYAMSKIEVVKYLEKKTGVRKFNFLYLDLNGDNEKDLLACEAVTKKEKRQYYCILKQKDTYTVIGELPLVEDQFTRLASKHNGYFDFLVYMPINTKKGRILRYQHDGSTYIAVSSTTVSKHFVKLLKQTDP
ncbi:MAG: hypothetical protein HQK83_02630 [Fibrobacteria bacterium]|nr:hypothetical protein [Fibrobacteria bacterium]